MPILTKRIGGVENCSGGHHGVLQMLNNLDLEEVDEWS